MTTTAPQNLEFQARAAFDFIRYANTWEDASVLCQALEPVGTGGRLLTVASAGDNALALLTLDPAEVVAADISPAQLACLELRVAAFRHLDDLSLQAFLGVKDSPGVTRLNTYYNLRGDLSAAARDFWDQRPRVVERGIIHAGKFERYLRFFRRWVLPLVHSRKSIRGLRRARLAEDQARFYDEKWDTWRWRLLFRVMFSRPLLAWLARKDPAFLVPAEGPVAERVLERVRHVVRHLPTYSNPFLAYMLTGNFPPEALPMYLRPEHTPFIRRRLDRLRLVSGRLEQAGGGPYDGIGCSDIFEYMNPDEHVRCYQGLLGLSRPGTRLVYWNMLVPRATPPALSQRVRPLRELATELQWRDRAWFYQQVHVDEVL
jgi:S-adenosylmethionine-diacylglycerol 3-amino-3-carboxypropyl transferase